MIKTKKLKAVGGDELSQEIDNYGIDGPEDRLKKQLGVLIEDRKLIMEGGIGISRVAGLANFGHRVSGFP